jgi:hypothetical protein
MNDRKTKNADEISDNSITREFCSVNSKTGYSSVTSMMYESVDLNDGFVNFIPQRVTQKLQIGQNGLNNSG